LDELKTDMGLEVFLCPGGVEGTFSFVLLVEIS
jgi:hypothetical protein